MNNNQIKIAGITAIVLGGFFLIASSNVANAQVTYSSIQQIDKATRYMNQIGNFAEECSFLLQIDDTSRMEECINTMNGLGSLLEQYVSTHPIIEELG